MRFEIHMVKTPTWTQSAYGEPVATYGEAEPVSMMIAWNTMTDQNMNNAIYEEFAFVGLTRETVAEGSLIDDKYIAGHVEPGRWNRVFMKHAEGKDREYGE